MFKKKTHFIPLNDHLTQWLKWCQIEEKKQTKKNNDEDIGLTEQFDLICAS